MQQLNKKGLDFEGTNVLIERKQCDIWKQSYLWSERRILSFKILKHYVFDLVCVFQVYPTPNELDQKEDNYYY